MHNSCYHSPHERGQQGLTVEAGLQNSGRPQAEALYDGVLDPPGGRGCARQEGGSRKVFTQALEC